MEACILVIFSQICSFFPNLADIGHGINLTGILVNVAVLEGLSTVKRIIVHKSQSMESNSTILQCTKLSCLSVTNKPVEWSVFPQLKNCLKFTTTPKELKTDC